MIHFIYNLSIFAKLDKVILPTGCILSTLNLPLVYMLLVSLQTRLLVDFVDFFVSEKVFGFSIGHPEASTDEAISPRT